MTRFTVSAGEGPSRRKRMRVYRELFQITRAEEEEEENFDTEENEDENSDDDEELDDAGNGGQQQEHQQPQQEAPAPALETAQQQQQDRDVGGGGAGAENQMWTVVGRTAPIASEPTAASAVVESSHRYAFLTVTLTDPEVLDCSICFEPLTIPVFQCENGHIACSPCCRKLAHKCPSCSLPIGYNRCRAIEKVLEAVKIPCENNKYGCQESVSYSKKCDHDKSCNYAACLCPIAGCSFVSSYKPLYFHVSSRHKASVRSFQFSVLFPVLFLASSGAPRILQEEKEGTLFILNNRVESLGNVVAVKCIAPTSAKGTYFYDLTAKGKGGNLRLQSFTKSTRNTVDHSPSVDFLLVPKDFCGSYGQISIDLCIWPQGSYPVGISCPENVQRSSSALYHV